MYAYLGPARLEATTDSKQQKTPMHTNEVCHSCDASKYEIGDKELGFLSHLKFPDVRSDTYD